jgi:hypothetical protein
MAAYRRGCGSGIKHAAIVFGYRRPGWELGSARLLDRIFLTTIFPEFLFMGDHAGLTGVACEATCDGTELVVTQPTVLRAWDLGPINLKLCSLCNEGLAGRTE